MLKSQEFVAKMLECDPNQLTLVAVTLQNEGSKGSQPKMSSFAYYMVDKDIEGLVGGRFYVCDLFTPASIQKRTEHQAAKAIWRCENQRFNPDYPEVAPPKEEMWLAPRAAEEMGISLTSALINYEVIIGTPGHYNGADHQQGDRIVTSYIKGMDHDIIMKNASHIRFR